MDTIDVMANPFTPLGFEFDFGATIGPKNLKVGGYVYANIIGFEFPVRAKVLRIVPNSIAVVTADIATAGFRMEVDGAAILEVEA